jgi:hypothetical protein
MSESKNFEHNKLPNDNVFEKFLLLDDFNQWFESVWLESIIHHDDLYEQAVEIIAKMNRTQLEIAVTNLNVIKYSNYGKKEYESEIEFIKRLNIVVALLVKKL